jgi:hypothetical protein
MFAKGRKRSGTPPATALKSHNSNRREFTARTRQLIAERAGHQCSFPTCNRRTIGAGHALDQVSRTGKAAHIFAAAPGGPRGQGGLTPDELGQPENGIWLCSDHATLVDNNRGAAFPPETLLSYKSLQEARVMREIQGLYSPIGWVHELTVYENPLFASGQKVRFAKLNLFFGGNETGKTALTEWIAGCFDCSYLACWSREGSRSIHVSLSFLNPEAHQIDLRVKESGALQYHINGNEISFNPMGLRIIRPRELQFSGDDDLGALASALSLHYPIVRNLVQEIHAFPYAHVRNIRFEKGEDGLMRLVADVDGTVPGLRRGMLSRGKVEQVFLEFATAAARVSGRYAPTLLILDGCPLFLYEGIFDYYSHHFLDPDNQFQTIMCIPSRELDLDALRWKGWEVVRTIGCRPEIAITQEPRIT